MPSFRLFGASLYPRRRLLIDSLLPEVRIATGSIPLDLWIFFVLHRPSISLPSINLHSGGIHGVSSQIRPASLAKWFCSPVLSVSVTKHNTTLRKKEDRNEEMRIYRSGSSLDNHAEYRNFHNVSLCMEPIIPCLCREQVSSFKQ